MIIKYKTGSLEKVCTNLKEAKKKFSGRIPEKLLAAVNVFCKRKMHIIATEELTNPDLHFCC